MKRLLSLMLSAAMLLCAPVTAAAAPADNADLVTDAYTYESQDQEGLWRYHIPRVNLEGDGTEALNAAIWDDLYNGYMYTVLDSLESMGWADPVGIRYTWSVSGDVLSICAVAEGATDCDTYYIYNLSLTSGERLSDSELFTAAGVTRTQFNDLLRQAVNDWYDDLPDVIDADFIQTQRDHSLSSENLASAMPYIGRGGALCAVVWIYAIAGAERYLEPLTLIPGDMDGQLVYFIEHCDSETFTRADLEGFDEQMCTYAVNGVYARSGRAFQSQDLQEYFDQFDWYEPTVAPEAFTYDLFNDCQSANLTLLLAYQEEQGY